MSKKIISTDLTVESACKELKLRMPAATGQLFCVFTYLLERAIVEKKQEYFETNYYRLSKRTGDHIKTVGIGVRNLESMGFFNLDWFYKTGHQRQLKCTPTYLFFEFIEIHKKHYKILNKVIHNGESKASESGALSSPLRSLKLPSQESKAPIKYPSNLCEEPISENLELDISKYINVDCMYTEPTLSSEIPLTENSARQTDYHLKMIDIWNELIQPSKFETMTASIEKKCHEAFTSHFDANIDRWKDYCSRIASSRFLMGEKFTLTLGWALKAEWIQKVLNGGYDDHEWRKENDMAKKKEPVRLGSITLEDVLADCKNEIDRKIKPILYQQLGADQYASWIHRTSAAFYMKGNQLCVNSCSVFVQSQIKQRFWDKMSIARIDDRSN